MKLRIAVKVLNSRNNLPVRGHTMAAAMKRWNKQSLKRRTAAAERMESK